MAQMEFEKFARVAVPLVVFSIIFGTVVFGVTDPDISIGYKGDVDDDLQSDINETEEFGDENKNDGDALNFTRTNLTLGFTWNWPGLIRSESDQKESYEKSDGSDWKSGDLIDLTYSHDHFNYIESVEDGYFSIFADNLTVEKVDNTTLELTEDTTTDTIYVHYIGVDEDVRQPDVDWTFDIPWYEIEVNFDAATPDFMDRISAMWNFVSQLPMFLRVIMLIWPIAAIMLFIASLDIGI